MRITYRKNDSFAYWTQRWADVEADEAMENRASYPLKYALEAVARSFAPNGGRICEAGCGNGRLVRYFMRNGYHIRGFDFIPEAISKIKNVEPAAEVETGDILNLSYPDEYFDTFLAFGLYHSLPYDSGSGDAGNVQSFKTWWRFVRIIPGGQHMYAYIRLSAAICSGEGENEVPQA